MTRLSMALVVACLAALSAPASAAPARRGSVCEGTPWIAEGLQPDGRFGTVAPAGDVNGDGYDDVVIGCYNCDHGEIDEGMVLLYLGTSSGLSSAPACTLESNQAGARMGDKLSSAGDVNGDGYDDVIVGAAFFDSTLTDEGAAFLYLGGPSGVDRTPAWSAYGRQAFASFGLCAQGAGDVNDDGYADVIVGAWLHDEGQQNEGKAYLYLGSSSGLGASAAWTAQSNSANAVFGYFCTGAGDLDDDGYDDVVVGARRFSGNGLDREGRVYVYPGGPGGPSPTAGWIHDGGQQGGEFGASVAKAGDVNGDGFGDLLVGAFRFDHPEVDEGMAFVFAGSDTGLADTPLWSAEGDQAGAYFGYHVDAAGDVDQDGFGDVVLSASLYEVAGMVEAGRGYLYRGGAAGPEAAPAWIQEGDQAGAELGDAVRGVGDVNGDGLPEIMTGALYRDGPWVDCGRAYLFYGCPGPPTGVTPSAATTRLAVLGPNPFRTGVELSFTLARGGAVRLTVHDLAGRAIATLVHGDRAAGTHRAGWDGRGQGGAPAPAGIYFLRLSCVDGSAETRLLRLR